MLRFTLMGVTLSSALTFSSVCVAAVITVDINGGGDYVAIQPAIDAAVDGDTVLVKPGEYVITEPISVRRKAIMVKGENGSEETTIRMSEPSDPDRATVVIFGKSNLSVLEGFTVTGGK